MTGLDQLHYATHNQIFAIIWLSIEVVVMVCVALELVRHFIARGTRARYILTTLIRTLAVPAILVKMSDIVMDGADKDYFDMGIDVLITGFLIAKWYWTKDDENWWKGRGKKLGRWGKRLFTRSSRTAPQAA